MSFDTIDKSILEELQTDSKQTNKELANKLNLSVTAIYERVKKLEKSGFIEGYTAIVNTEKINKNFVVFCHVKLLQHSQEHIINFENEVSQLNEVLECYHVSGDYDYLLRVLVEDMPAFREFMVKKLTNISHIGSTRSMFVINKVKNTTVIKFE